VGLRRVGACCARHAQQKLFATVPTTREGLLAYAKAIRNVFRDKRGLEITFDEIDLILRTIAKAARAI